MFSTKIKAAFAGYGDHRQNSNGEYTWNIKLANPETQGKDWDKPLVAEIYGNENCTNFKNQKYKQGEILEVEINISTFEGLSNSTGKAFALTSARIWKHARVQAQQSAAQGAQQIAPPPSIPSATQQGAPPQNYTGQQVQDINNQHWWSDGKNWHKAISGKWVIEHSERPVFPNAQAETPPPPQKEEQESANSGQGDLPF